MSIINLGLQDVAIMRDEMSLHMEEIFEKADTLEQIREAAKKNSNLKSELENCICNVQELLCTRTERLVLHNVPFKTKEPANEEIIEEFFEVKFIQYIANKIIMILNFILFLQVILSIDRTLKISDTTIDILSKKKDLQQFMQTHCQIQHYSFQVIF